MRVLHAQASNPPRRPGSGRSRLPRLESQRGDVTREVRHVAIYFYRSRDVPYGCFSNFSAHGVEMDGLWWPTVEHYFQGQKFPGQHLAESIRSARTPKEAKRLGTSAGLRCDWERVKDDIMRAAVLCKFRTHGSIRNILLATEGEELVENAPFDYYWGCGHDGSGRNMLGTILMEVREHLRSAG